MVTVMSREGWRTVSRVARTRPGGSAYPRARIYAPGERPESAMCRPRSNIVAPGATSILVRRPVADETVSVGPRRDLILPDVFRSATERSTLEAVMVEPLSVPRTVAWTPTKRAAREPGLPRTRRRVRDEMRTYQRFRAASSSVRLARETVVTVPCKAWSAGTGRVTEMRVAVRVVPSRWPRARMWSPDRIALSDERLPPMLTGMSGPATTV